MLKDIVRSVLFGMIISLVLVLIFAIVVKYFVISDPCIDIVNIIIKGISISLGCMFGIKESYKGLIKGLIIGVLYFILTFILFSLLNQSFDMSAIRVFDLFVPILFASAFSVLKVNTLSKQ